jgi:hypothetical protein
MNQDLRKIADPLSETTRAERKWLVVSSFGIVGLSWGGVIPTRISVSGIEFGAINQVLLVAVAWSVCAYLLVAFLFHYSADRLATEYLLAQHNEDFADEWLKERGEQGLSVSDEVRRQIRKAVGDTFGQLRRRYRFDLWSAVAISAVALVVSATWLFLRIAMTC